MRATPSLRFSFFASASATTPDGCLHTFSTQVRPTPRITVPRSLRLRCMRRVRWRLQFPSLLCLFDQGLQISQGFHVACFEFKFGWADFHLNLLGGKDLHEHIVGDDLSNGNQKYFAVRIPMIIFPCI